MPRRARGSPALHPWRVPCRWVSGNGMRVEPSLMHHEGGSWTAVRTHTPIKFSKVRTEPLAPIPLDRSKFRENGSQPPPNRTGHFRIIRLSSFHLSSALGCASVVDTWTGRFGSPHLAYLAVLTMRKPASLRRWAAITPLPGWTAFPSADYYGSSVTLGLAPRRPSRTFLLPDVIAWGRWPVRSVLRVHYPLSCPRRCA